MRNMGSGDVVLLIILINSLLVMALVAFVVWWHLWGKRAHYRRVLIWSHVTHWKHHEHDAAVAYFRKHGKSS